jgi:predicted GIY-YIG superfamily endonuclease
VAPCWVYILKCADGSLYTGYTLDLGRRLAQHRAGKASKYTRSRRPVTLAYAEPAGSRGGALRREWAIKKLSRKAKQDLCSAWEGHSSR